VCPIATPKKPLIAMSFIGTDRTNFFGLNIYPKVPEPQMYKFPNLSIAPE
jgi:hypothetical protein